MDRARMCAGNFPGAIHDEAKLLPPWEGTPADNRELVVLDRHVCTNP